MSEKHMMNEGVLENDEKEAVSSSSRERFWPCPRPLPFSPLVLLPLPLPLEVLKALSPRGCDSGGISPYCKRSKVRK